MEPFEFLHRRWHRLFQRPLPPVPPLMPFWYPGCLDHVAGGYRLNHDAAGRWLGPADKFLIPHARTCWFFSRLSRFEWLPEALPAARLGVEYLRDHLWSGPQDGFSWSSSDRRKLLIGQAFALYGISEYAGVSGDPGAASLAHQVFVSIERNYRDPASGGYQCVERAATGTPALKSMNEHLHVLEAYAAFASIANDPAVRNRILELIVILTCTMLRSTAGATTDGHRTDWTPLLDREHARASYGHDIEATWLVLDACRTVGLPANLVLDWCRTLFESVLRWGWHRNRGGVYFAGPLNGPADTRENVWWVQAESLVAGLTLFRMTGDPRCAMLYLSVLRWVETRQADWQGGDWHAIIWPSGRITGEKANQWKTPYHNGRAMLRCLELLEPDRETA